MNGNVEEKIRASCWSSEGLWGDMTCPRLKELGHCFNCEVYAAAGKVLFDKDATKRRRDFPLETVRQTPDISEEAKGKTASYFLFKLGCENFAIDLKGVVRVTHPRGVHRIPHRDDKIVRGLVNIGGEIMPAASLCDVLGIPRPPDSAEKGRMFVYRIASDAFAFQTNSALGVARVSEADVADAASVENAMKSPFVDKAFLWRGEMVSVLDMQLVFHAIFKKFL